MIDGRVDRKKQTKIKILTSTLRRARETSMYVAWAGSVEQYIELIPMEKGGWTGAKFEEAKQTMPEFHKRWRNDRFHTRWPGGESYDDVRARIETALIEIEQQSAPVLVVAHGTVLQLLYCYFSDKNVEECHEVKFPHHTVMEFLPVNTRWSSSGGSYTVRKYTMPQETQTPVSPRRSNINTDTKRNNNNNNNNNKYLQSTFCHVYFIYFVCVLCCAVLCASSHMLSYSQAINIKHDILFNFY